MDTEPREFLLEHTNPALWSKMNFHAMNPDNAAKQYAKKTAAHAAPKKD